MYSIRNRLNLGIIGGMILLLTAAAVFLYFRVASQVEQAFDAALVDKAHALMQLTELDEEGLEFDFAEDGVMAEFVRPNRPEYYQLWARGKTLLIKSPSLGEANLPLIGAGLDRQHFSDLTLPDGRAGRAVEIGFLPRVEIEFDDDEVRSPEPPEAQSISLVFAREREALDATLLTMGTTVFGVVIGVLLLSALLVTRLVGQGLRPLSQLAEQVHEIDESRLDTRLTHAGKQSLEIAPIEDQINYMLERLQSAFERERRFSANVAHELRTPLSELKTLAEVGRMVPEDTAQVRGFFDDVEAISGQMEKIVVTLLELARSEAGLLYADPEDVELSAYCDEIWQQAVDSAGAGRTLHKQIPEGLVINTDREKLGMILSNLFVNAVSYSPTDAEVRVVAEIRDRSVVLEVSNAAIDLRPEDVVHMKDRFWRKQQVSDRGGHSGLGLTLVEALARVMQLDVNLALDRQQVFMVRISGLRSSL